MQASWTRDKRSGGWVILAAVTPGSVLPAKGDEITVTKKSGETQTITAARVSRSFTGKFGPTKGMQCVFITPLSRRAQSSHSGHGYHNGAGWNGNSGGAARYCWECGGTHTGGIGDECGG